MFCQTSSERTCGFNCAQWNFGHSKNLMFLFIILEGFDISISLIKKKIWDYISKIKILNKFDSKT